MTQLKPCKYCGGKMFAGKKYQTNGSSWPYVKCTKCSRIKWGSWDLYTESLETDNERA